MKLPKLIDRILEKYRLDSTVEAILSTVPWDDLLLALSNVCVYQSQREKKKADQKIWYDRAKLLHKAMNEAAKPTIQPRKKKVKSEVSPEGDINAKGQEG